ncbi:hypothetical protein AB0I39_06555 [Kitasatospora purpeofusca]|uniref:hypothetical protein n=1 Tax=Kitasatospora purpeofusca TaxID=67352 RepID=UPI0033E7FFC7
MMRRLVNRAALALAGLVLTGTSTAVLLTAAAPRLAAHWPAWIPHDPSAGVAAPDLPQRLLTQQAWDRPLPLALAAAGALCLILLLAQALPRTPSSLRLDNAVLTTRALVEAVRTRALLVDGITEARVTARGGRTPALELTAGLADHVTPDDTIAPLLSILTDAEASTGRTLRLRLRLTTARTRPLRPRPRRSGLSRAHRRTTGRPTR